MGNNEVWFLTLLLTVSMVAGSSRIEDQWTLETTSNAGFNHMVIDRQTGKLYIAAVNKLFVFDDTLQAPYEVQLGPREDNIDCPPKYPNGTRSCNETLKLMPVFNKGLVIDHQNKRLIACTNLFQGTCEKHYLDNVLYREEDESKYVPMVGNDPWASTVLFIAPAPGSVTNHTEHPQEALYVGSQRSRSGPAHIKDMVPFITARRLRDFKSQHTGISTNTELKHNTKYRDTFPVIYKYGFGYQGFSYFVVVQKENSSADNFVSKITRICQDGFNTYAEVQLQCVRGGEVYNLAQAAYIGKPGTSLAKTLGIPATEEVLFVVFSKSIPNSAEPLRESALCAYPMSYVRKVFTQNTRACYDGKGTTGPAYITEPSPCIRVENVTIDEDSCMLDSTNIAIDGPIPVSGTANVNFQYTASSITILNEEHHTVAFIGTANGHLLKVVLGSDAGGVVYDDIVLDEGSKVNAEMFLDNSTRYLYALTDNKVQKISVHNWRKYETCGDCKGVKGDPYCDVCTKADATSGNSGTSSPGHWISLTVILVSVFVSSVIVTHV